MELDTQTTIFIYSICILFILVPVTYYIYALTTQRNNSLRCDNFNIFFGTKNTKITSINYDDINYKYPLRDYYIKTAYNCCCAGNYKNDYVSLCALKDIIKQGVRCLDIEVYSVNNLPVIAASTTNIINEKETYNSIYVGDFLECITTYCFSDGGICPNPFDPLILHIRFKSNNELMYDNLCNLFEQYTLAYLLPNTYNYEYQNVDKQFHYNLGAVNITKLRQKLIIIAANTDSSFHNNKFYEYINMTSNSANMYLLTEYQVKNYPSIAELTYFNKQHMTMETPDMKADPLTPNSIAGRELGIQCIAMRYNVSNTGLLIANEAFFDSNGHAFVLKPEKLRYTPISFPNPAKLPDSLSAKPRDISFNQLGIKELPI